MVKTNVRVGDVVYLGKKQSIISEDHFRLTNEKHPGRPLTVTKVYLSGVGSYYMYDVKDNYGKIYIGCDINRFSRTKYSGYVKRNTNVHKLDR